MRTASVYGGLNIQIFFPPLTFGRFSRPIFFDLNFVSPFRLLLSILIGIAPYLPNDGFYYNRALLFTPEIRELYESDLYTKVFAADFFKVHFQTRVVDCQ